MELWVRSQDKDILMKVDSLIIDEDKKCIFTHDKINSVGMTYTLGKYKTKERTFEVLDEIQEYLKFSKNAEINNKDFLRYLNEVCGQEKCNEILNNISVYEMPKDVK